MEWLICKIGVHMLTIMLHIEDLVLSFYRYSIWTEGDS